jgi:purine-binding chemotaxis protein CheW
MSARPTQDKANAVEGIVSIRIGDQTFGVPVMKAQDVIAQVAINVIPLSPVEVAGSLNLRGRIVTAIDMRRRMNMPPRGPDDPYMCVIAERAGELYALLVDDVGDVLWLSSDACEPTPVTISPTWRTLCSALYRLEKELLLVLDVDKVLALHAPALCA